MHWATSAVSAVPRTQHTEKGRNMEFTIGDATVKVEHDGQDFDPDFRAYRQRYTYIITTPDWQYVGNDIRSGCSAEADVADASRSLFSFLSACAESRSYGGGENSDLFPEHVGEWAEENSDELSILSIDPAELD
ncbi:hypothetical protein FDH96_gp107 [Mycobacterium phage Rey]|uniref:Uncharacterized protein n=1 Tax=Mycobacterium phage Rey TaxID=1034115 RepID=G1D5L2_9CAUD|nr:hypothetical protein FDH96_gp107 [Mycobacterium phage Rey]AEK10060.1 hypothetical protein PBI_REY_172 [Mycobacterium phage Rey]